jgi:hypothetical protein
MHTGNSITSLQSTQAALAPPPPAPHGPRSPAQLSLPSRTPSPEWTGGPPNGSPETSSLESVDSEVQNGLELSQDDGNISSEPARPSAKALGKRKVVQTEEPDGRLLFNNDPFALYLTFFPQELLTMT